MQLFQTRMLSYFGFPKYGDHISSGIWKKICVINIKSYLYNAAIGIRSGEQIKGKKKSSCDFHPKRKCEIYVKYAKWMKLCYQLNRSSWNRVRKKKGGRWKKVYHQIWINYSKEKISDRNTKTKLYEQYKYFFFLQFFSFSFSISRMNISRIAYANLRSTAAYWLNIWNQQRRAKKKIIV